MKGRCIAYLRMSTNGQDIEKDKGAILKLANEKDLGRVEWVEDAGVSGRISWRQRKIAGILDDLKAGDALIVSELSRLGRSLLDILEILKIASEKQIRVYAVKNNWQLDGSLQSKILSAVLGLAAEIEAALISERTKAGLAAARAKGKMLGRPRGPGKSKLDQFRPEIEALLKNGSSKSFVARRYQSSVANLHGWLKMRGIDVRPVYERGEGS